MIVEAVLREVYGGAHAADAKVVRPETALENLARFFESKRRKELAGAARVGLRPAAVSPEEGISRVCR
jgi:hypothetical protein